MLKKFVGWLRGRVREEVQDEIKDNLAELREQIQAAFYQGTQEALAAVRQDFARQARVTLTRDDLEGHFTLPGEVSESHRINGLLPCEAAMPAAVVPVLNGKAKRSRKAKD